MNKERVLSGENQPSGVPSPSIRSTARCWMLTLNFNPGSTFESFSPAETIAFEMFQAASKVSPCTFCVYQGEQGKKTGTCHLQGYAEFERAVTMNTVRKHFGLSVYAKPRFGTQEQAIAYCTKEETRVSAIVRVGTPMRTNKAGGTAGVRTDWDAVWTQIKDGKTICEIIEDRPNMIPNVGALKKAQWESRQKIKRELKTKLIVLYGDAQTGKTSTANKLAALYGDYYRPLRGNNGVWFDGYNPHEHSTVIIDEFTGSFMSATMLNELSDQWPLWVDTKGGVAPFLARRLILTSNYAPSDWYDFKDKKKHLCWDALWERIDVLVKFTVMEHHISGAKNMILQKKLDVEEIKGILPFKDKVLSSKYPIIGATVPSTPIISISSESDESSSTPKRKDIETYAGMVERVGKKHKEDPLTDESPGDFITTQDLIANEELDSSEDEFERIHGKGDKEYQEIKEYLVGSKGPINGNN